MADEFEVIEPERLPVKWKGRDIMVGPMEALQIARVSRALKGVPLGELVASFAPEGGAEGAEVEGLARAWDFLGEHGERVYEALALAAAVPVEEVHAANPSELLALGAAVVSVNLDFFVRCLPAQLARAAAAVQRARASRGAGLTPSKP